MRLCLGCVRGAVVMGAAAAAGTAVGGTGAAVGAGTAVGGTGAGTPAWEGAAAGTGMAEFARRAALCAFKP
jgi:hypothetical protein